MATPLALGAKLLGKIVKAFGLDSGYIKRKEGHKGKNNNESTHEKLLCSWIGCSVWKARKKMDICISLKRKRINILNSIVKQIMEQYN